MGNKGKTFKTYSLELRKEALRLHLEGGGTKARYSLIRQVNERGQIQRLCQLFGVSKSGYYAWLKRQSIDRDVQVKHVVSKVYTKYKGIYGYRQLQLFMWHDEGVWMNHKKVLRLMQNLGLQSRMRKKRRYRYATHQAERIAENRLNQNFVAHRPNEKWVTDITQVLVGESWLYLSPSNTYSIMKLWRTLWANIPIRNGCSRHFNKHFENEKT